jgi:hypothetical protein
VDVGLGEVDPVAVGAVGPIGLRVPDGVALGAITGDAGIDGDADRVGAGEPDPPGDRVGAGVDGVGTTAIGDVGLGDTRACSCNAVPPTPSATVTRTRLTIPRPRTRRARWLGVTAIRALLLVRSGPFWGLPDGTRG